MGWGCVTGSSQAGRMLTLFRTIAAALTVVVLEGCSAQVVTEAKPSAPPTKVASPAPSATPSPKIMTGPEAVELYKTTACSANLPLRRLQQRPPVRSGDIGALHSTAATARDASSAAATKLDQALWPEDLKADAAAVRDGDFSQS